MTEIYGQGGPLPSVPHDMTCSQFMFSCYRLPRPQVENPGPWLIDDATGRKVYVDEVRTRTWGLANAFSIRWKIGYPRVCVFSPNHIDYPIVIWAIHTLGAIATTANPAYTADELEYQLSMTKAEAIVTSAESYPVALAVAQKAGIAPDHVVLLDPLSDGSKPLLTVSDLIAEGYNSRPNFVERRLKPGEGKTKLAFLCMSSGTTGKPKAVRIPHYAPIANVVQMAHLANLQKTAWEDRAWRPDFKPAVLPFYHIYGLVVVMHWTIFYGFSLVVVPNFNFVDFLKTIQRHRVNFINIVPPMAVLLCKHPASHTYNLRSLRSVMSGAAPLSAEVTRALAQRLPHCHIGQGFGLTETSTTVAWPGADTKLAVPGSAGRLMPGCVARVVRADGSLAGYGEPGELVVKGPTLALGYLDNEKATKETFRDGWVWTGDEVIITRTGDLFVVDRIKELIKVKGFQVAPAELEGHILSHPDASDVGVVGIPDDYSGELPLAFVVPSVAAAARIKVDPAEADRVRAALIKHVADAKIEYKHLTGGVEFLDIIPKNPSGKLLRRLLRDRAQEMQKLGKLSSVTCRKTWAKL
ncbi:amp dependent CoA ligase [Amylocystis lapponica]|nr:amp dependent CoA ligase [Amylocystis lapponica]